MNLSILLPFLLLLCLVGMMFLSSRSPVNTESRELYLRTLTEYLNGTLIALSDRQNCYRIDFTYNDLAFVYEDMESSGFYNKVYSSYLKTKTLSSLTLEFVEKERKKIISNELLMVSDIVDDGLQTSDGQLVTPKPLQNMKIMTNDPMKTNVLLQDSEIVNIFNHFQSFDRTGHYFLALKIIDGEIILTFHPSGTFNPRPLHLQKNMQSLQAYLEKMATLVETLKKV